VTIKRIEINYDKVQHHLLFISKNDKLVDETITLLEERSKITHKYKLPEVSSDISTFIKNSDLLIIENDLFRNCRNLKKHTMEVSNSPSIFLCNEAEIMNNNLRNLKFLPNVVLSVKCNKNELFFNINLILKKKKLFNENAEHCDELWFYDKDKYYHRLKFKKIYFIKGKGETTTLYYLSKDNKTKSIVYSCSLKKALKQVPKQTFIRVHDSYAVNKSNINSISFCNMKIRLNDQFSHIEIPISKTYKKEFKSRFKFIKTKP